MDEPIKILKRSTLFNALDKNGLIRLQEISEQRRVQEGEILATRKEPASFFFIILEGGLLLTLTHGRSLVIDTPGDFIAMELLSSKGFYTSTLTALTDGSVLAVNRDDFLSFIQEDSQEAKTVMENWHDFLAHTAPFVEQPDILTNDYQY